MDAVVHAVGGLFPSRKPGRSLSELNKESCVNMASILNKYAMETNTTRNFVMISSAKAPFFLPSYLSTKVEAENFLIDNCPDLKCTIIKPGVIVDAEHRWWSIQAQGANDIFYKM